MYFKAIRIAHSLTKLFLARRNRPDALEFCDKPGFVFTILTRVKGLTRPFRKSLLVIQWLCLRNSCVFSPVTIT